MTVIARPRTSLRFRGRSLLVMVLTPEPPLSAWLEELTAIAERSVGFFTRRPVILDVSLLPPDRTMLMRLVAELAARDVRVLGLDGAHASVLGDGLPPLVGGGRDGGAEEVIDALSRETGASRADAAPRVSSLLIDGPVRSGQSVVFAQGDVTVVGSIASGAEVIAGGSIHVYGTLRGRALAGSVGNAAARVFCNRLQAELVAIDGYYRTADDFGADVRDRATQAWLEGDVLRVAPIN